MCYRERSSGSQMKDSRRQTVFLPRSPCEQRGFTFRVVRAKGQVRTDLDLRLFDEILDFFELWFCLAKQGHESSRNSGTGHVQLIGQLRDGSSLLGKQSLTCCVQEHQAIDQLVEFHAIGSDLYRYGSRTTFGEEPGGMGLKPWLMDRMAFQFSTTVRNGSRNSA